MKIIIKNNEGHNHGCALCLAFERSLAPQHGQQIL